MWLFVNEGRSVPTVMLELAGKVFSFLVVLLSCSSCNMVIKREARICLDFYWPETELGLRPASNSQSPPTS